MVVDKMSDIQRLTLTIDSLPDGGFVLIDAATGKHRRAISSSHELVGVIHSELEAFTQHNAPDLPAVFTRQSNGIQPDQPVSRLALWRRNA